MTGSSLSSPDRFGREKTWAVPVLLKLTVCAVQNADTKRIGSPSRAPNRVRKPTHPSPQETGNPEGLHLRNIEPAGTKSRGRIIE